MAKYNRNTIKEEVTNTKFEGENMNEQFKEDIKEEVKEELKEEVIEKPKGFYKRTKAWVKKTYEDNKEEIGLLSIATVGGLLIGSATTLGAHMTEVAIQHFTSKDMELEDGTFEDENLVEIDEADVEIVELDGE